VATWVLGDQDNFTSNKIDFVLGPKQAGQDSNKVKQSHTQKGELSYYYSHDGGSSAPSATAAEKCKPKALKEGEADTSFKNSYNKKQSPFGTDISLYDTISKYSWEDTNHATVKVFVPMPDIGKLAD